MYLGILLLTSLTITVFSLKSNNKCDLSKDLTKEIRSYAPKVNKIIEEAVKGKFKRFVYKELSIFVDKYRHRVPGSQDLNNAITYMIKKLKTLGLENVHTEDVTDIPTWKRGKESANLYHPFTKEIPILGLGGSVGTNSKGITAEAIVVNSFEELNCMADKVPNKIVVFNQKWEGYEKTVLYRLNAASKVATYGGRAALVRSITPFSLNTPHTGDQTYSKNIRKIPVACITVEDAHLLQRLYNKGEKLVINLKMGARILPKTTSQNTIAEIKGRQKPKKVVLISGHLDNWDVGQGASDDGGGAFISWSVLVLLNNLHFRPRRTLRSVLWTAEEVGYIGGYAYYRKHTKEIDNFDLLMESDQGTFNPLGMKFNGSDKAACIIQEILGLLHSINATKLKRTKDVDSEITIWSKTGVQLASLLNDNAKYFWFHHSEADTIDIEDSNALDKCLATWAAVSYVVADLSIDLPRK